MYVGVIALAVASVSMSVAWYAAARSLYINGINIRIDTDRDLKISTSLDGDYVEKIDHIEHEADGVFFPLTSAHSSLWMSEKKDMPVFYDESRNYDTEVERAFEEASTGYYSQKYYLKADDDLYITIDPEKTFIKANKDYNSGYASYLYEKYQSEQDPHYSKYSEKELLDMLNHVVEAMRFSILIKDEEEYSYTIFDPYYSEATFLGGTLDNDVDEFFDFYKKTNTNEYVERVYGEVIALESQYVYDEGLSEDSELIEGQGSLPSAFNARHKQGIKRFNLEESKKKGLEIKKEEVIDLNNFTYRDFYFPVYRDKPKEVVISLYIEGWDKQSVNYTMGAAFTSDITFKIAREM